MSSFSGCSTIIQEHRISEHNLIWSTTLIAVKWITGFFVKFEPCLPLYYILMRKGNEVVVETVR